jgi:hypothetical protein
MTEPSPARPVPGPPRPGSASAQEPLPDDDRFTDLDQRPVSEHVAVFEAEHDRLQRELGTIDRL